MIHADAAAADGDGSTTTTIKRYHCDKCSKVFSRKDNFRGHVKTHTPTEFCRFFCDRCSKGYQRKYALKVHLERGVCLKEKKKNDEKNDANNNSYYIEEEIPAEINVVAVEIDGRMVDVLTVPAEF
jgi:RNase P subunit RPR2